MKPKLISIPQESSLYEQAKNADFADAYQIELNPPSNTSVLALWLTHIRKTPAWIEWAMAIRNRTASLLGLKNLGHLASIKPDKVAEDYQVGERLGIFTIMSITQHELILGDNDKHLNVYLSVLLLQGGSQLTVSTIVQRHNLLGRIYMWFVAPMHRIIAPAVLAKFAT